MLHHASDPLVRLLTVSPVCPVGSARDVTPARSPPSSRLPSRLGSRPLTPAQKREVQSHLQDDLARGFTASGLANQANREQIRLMTPRGKRAHQEELELRASTSPGFGRGDLGSDWLTASRTSSIGAHRTGAINGVIPRVLPDKLDWVLQARRRIEIQDDATRIMKAGGSYKDLADSKLKPKLPLMRGLVYAYDPPITLPSHNLADYYSQPSIGTFRIPFDAPKPSSLAVFSTWPKAQFGSGTSCSLLGFDFLASRDTHGGPLSP